MGDGRCSNCRDCSTGLRSRSVVRRVRRRSPRPHPPAEIRARHASLGSSGQHAGARRSSSWFDDQAAPLVVPVPLHKSRRRSRGFNQSELIARAAVRQLPRKLETLTDALVRQRDTISQVGLSREERIENVRDAFRVAQPSRVNGRDILLVDDVMTTGTTLSECARVLKQAGAERVWAATVARAFQSASQTDCRSQGKRRRSRWPQLPRSK